MEKTNSDIVIVQGQTCTEIPKERILYIEEYPSTIKRQKEHIQL
jgi:hypothetical protein